MDNTARPGRARAAKILDVNGNEACRQFLKNGACPRGDQCTYSHAAAASDAAAGNSQAPPRRGRAPRSSQPRLPPDNLQDEQQNEVCRRFYYLGKCPRGDDCQYKHVNGGQAAKDALAQFAASQPARAPRAPRNTNNNNNAGNTDSARPRQRRAPAGRRRNGSSAAGSAKPARVALPSTLILDEQNREICRQFYYLNACPRGSECKYIHVAGGAAAAEALAAFQASQAQAKPAAAKSEPRVRVPNVRVEDENGNEACRQFYFLGNCARNPCKFVHIAGPPDALARAKAENPAPARNPPRARAPKTDENGKEICRNFYNRGVCKNGETCQYAHVAGPPKDPSAAPAQSRRRSRTRLPPIPTERINDANGNECCRTFYHLGKCRRREGTCKFVHMAGPGADAARSTPTSAAAN